MLKQVCSQCNKEKELKFFYFRKNLNKYRINCKDCISIRNKDRYKKDHKKKKEYAKKYYFDNWEKRNKQRNEWIKNNKEKMLGYLRKANKKYYNDPKNKKAIRARADVRNALRNGKLKKEPCEICDDSRLVHAHHYKGYERENSLVVKWLCPKCHKDKEHE